MEQGIIVHEKPAHLDENRAPMIRYHSQKQLSLAEFDWPFQTALDANNRWVKLSECIPWDELAEGYYQDLADTQGRPSKDARLVIGAVIIKHKLCLSDRETVAQIQENPVPAVLSWACRVIRWKRRSCHPCSSKIRKRMGKSVFDVFQATIIDAVESAKTEQKKTTGKKPDQDDNEPPSVSGGGLQDEELEPQGKLILDATVAPQAIRYPTDLSLLNEAREFSEQIIDKLYPKTDWKKKPRTYREKARKAYLAIAKQRRPSGNTRRRGIKQQLQYLRRNLGHIERLLAYWPRVRHCHYPGGCYTATG